MNDPHVESLVYRLVTTETLVFQNPPALHHSTPAFDLHLEDGRLTVEMKDHYSSVESARWAVQPLLRSWELEWALKRGRSEMWFEYETANVVDRNPPPGASSAIQPVSGELVLTWRNATLIFSSPTYPPPPSGFAVSPDVEVLWRRYEMYTQGREQLPGMGFFCCTWIEALYGGTPTAARRLGISKEVLTTLRRIVSEKGDERTARKVTTTRKAKSPALHPLHPTEIDWAETVLRAVTRRVGMVAAGASTTPQLTMADFPRLSH